ncbi:ecdysteroid 22-kinase [Danaus plexippus plexippus]|uniref:Ecdysteroid 22-kinase n=1 Tax=Danaus plexippus plexippus TaxID=278856 RepID=A0A212EWN8_DANPL|nr:ecdysteroid 22-kinase [Danaus plexippus plexippus]
MTDAKKALRVLLDKVLQERRYEPSEIKIQEMPSGGQNYTSALFLISICLPEKELKLFAKVANIGKELRDIMQADWLYGTERFVYTRLMHLYNELQKDLKDEYRYVFPEFYGISEETGKETVIMENLVESGYEEYDRFKSLDWDHGRIELECAHLFWETRSLHLDHMFHRYTELFHFYHTLNTAVTEDVGLGDYP